MKELPGRAAPSMVHRPGGVSRASLNPQASEFVPSTTFASPASASRGAAVVVVPAPATAAEVAGAISSHQAYPYAPAPGPKVSRKGALTRERANHGHINVRHDGLPKSGDLTVHHESGMTQSTSAESAIPQPERAQGTRRNGRARKQNRDTTNTTTAVSERGHTGRGSARRRYDDRESVIDGKDRASIGVVGAAAAAGALQGRRRPASSGGSHPLRSSGIDDRDPNNRERRRRPLARAQAPAASSHEPTQDPSDGQPFTGGHRRGRRSSGGRSGPRDDRAGGDSPRLPRPKRTARLNDTHPTALANSGGGDPRGRASAGDELPGGAVTDARAPTARPRSKSSRIMASRPESVGRRGESDSEGLLVPPFTLGEDEAEEAFPALPPASGRRTATLTPPPPPPLPLEASTREPQRLDYSSLAERLAAEAAARAAVKAARSSSREGCTINSRESFLRLSVLPSFGDDRGGDPKVRGNGGASTELPRTQGLQPPWSASSSTDAGGTGPAVIPPLASSAPLPPPPSGPPTLAARTSENRRVGTTAATTALRVRLRERWYRLDAMRKAQRQREEAERRLMAAEDCESLGSGDRTRSSRRHDGNGGSERDCCVRKRRQRRVEQRCGAADDGSSYSSGGSSSGEGRTGGEDTADEGGSQHLRASLASLPTVPTEPASAVTPNHSDKTHVGISSGSGFDTHGGNMHRSQVTSEPTKRISAAGAAAIRRSEVTAAASAAAAAALRTTPAEASPASLGTSPNAPPARTTASVSTGPDKAAADVDLVTGSSETVGFEKRETRGELLREGVGDDGGDGNGGFRSGGVPIVPEERVSAACEAGMADLLNNFLVRSGGRAADGKDKLRRTPLHLAAESGALECVNLLLKRGTRLDQRDRWRETPLHKAARSGNADVVKALCAARMKVNVRNRYRETPLLLAVRANGVDAVGALLASGARLDDPDVNGVTPVCQAAMSGQAELLMTMVNSNQACRKSSNRETSAQHHIGGAADPAESSRGIASARQRALPLALRRGSGTQTNGGRAGGVGNGAFISALSPVHEAAAAGHVETLSLLMQLGVSLEERDAAAGVAGDTPLGRAVRGGQLDCVRLLLNAGVMIGRENARGETPLVVAIRAGQASAVELLTQLGAPLDGGGSHGRLTTADGRAPAGAREKMMARRRVEPLELALREGKLACAAVLVESGARIRENVLRSLKLEPAMAVVSTAKSLPQGSRARYAGTSPVTGGGRSTGNGAARDATGTAPVAALADTTLPLQTDILECMSPEISDIAKSAPLDGGGLTEDSPRHVDIRAGVLGGGWGLYRGRERGGEADAAIGTGGGGLEYVGGVSPALGECDITLILEDGSRLPAHSCLLAAFSGAFCDLFLGRRGRHRNCRGYHYRWGDSELTCASYGRRCSGTMGASPLMARGGGSVAGAPAHPAKPAADSSEEDLYTRSHHVQALLTGRTAPCVASRQQPVGPEAEVATAAMAAAYATTMVASGGTQRRRASAVIEWDRARGEVLVSFWGVGTMAAIVGHVYTGQPPAGVHVDGLGRLLCAAVSLRMHRLTRQVEHLLSATISLPRSGARSAQHEEVAMLLRGSRVLGAVDLEDRCTLYLQANGVFPAVMKMRRELGIPSINSSDVARGLARLNGTGYLGSGPSHAWSSSGAMSSSPVSAPVAAAKRAVDLSLRKRAVDFDHLVPLLLDPARCSTTLSIGRAERTILISAALADACPADVSSEAFTSPVGDKKTSSLTPSELHASSRTLTARGGSLHGGRERAAPLASNFSAFSHGLGRLLETGAMADVVLILSTERDSAEAELLATVDGVEGEVGAASRDGASECGGDGIDSNGSSLQEDEGGVSIEGGQGAPEEPLLVDGEEGPKTVGRSAREATTTTTKRETYRFPAHSLVLGARSEKFAAMLRFVRRQDGVCTGSEVDCTGADDEGNTASDGADSGCGFDSNDGGGMGRVRMCAGYGDCRGNGCDDNDTDGRGTRQSEDLPELAPDQGHGISRAGMREEAEPVPNRDRCQMTELRRKGASERTPPVPPGGCCRSPRVFVRRDLPPRELELHSPLLSPRSLRLFLEFLYTGVLDPTLSTGELSELALIADEYLVPDLTRQAEALLIECLVSRSASDLNCSSVAATDGPTRGAATKRTRGEEEEDPASTPLEVLQLGVSLGLPNLSVAAARAVLLHLEEVSRSGAFEASGMTKRELVVAALEAARS